MKRIHRLNKFIANKIAAGEVVDRPASVIKELVENSIDANASKIIIEIKDGGKSLIRITDNGTGIHESDVEIAFERHATSKIKEIEDLDSILSLGFRGEALASIASVSQVELITKTKDSLAGTCLELHGGEVIQHKEIGSSQGTTFVIKNLFYNVPARLQFMKSNTTETSYISDLISKFALAYPNISFRFINNGTIVFTTSGSGNVMNNIASIYGKEMAQNMMYISNKNESISLEGYISNPTISRGNKQLQVFFVNGRYIKNKMISEAVEEAYKTLVTINKYPMCFIYLKVPPQAIDVNIHPTKTEIRFNEELNIKGFIEDALKKKLLKENLIPNVSFEKSRKESEGHQERIIDLPVFSKPDVKIHKIESDIKGIEKKEEVQKSKEILVKDLVKEDKTTYHANNKVENNFIEPIIKQNMNLDIKKETEEVKKISDNKNAVIIRSIKVIGQLFHTYLIGQDDQHLYLIDQHAAHERILYDWLLKNYKEQSAASQKLLVPILVELSFAESEMVKKHVDLFIHLGFEIEEFGLNAFILRAVPMIFGEPEAKKFFIEIVDNIQKDVHNSYDMKIDKIISMACKQAIKAKDKLDDMEINELMKQLSNLENPFTCPHGRPIIVSMSKYEIEKKFKRI